MSSPPPSNPFLDAYESFCRNTPLVTRLVLSSAGVSYIMSYFISPEYLFANSAALTIMNFQLFRLFLSPFICDSILNLILGFMTFSDSGKRMEYAAGSTNFAALLLSYGGIINSLHNIWSFILYAITKDSVYTLDQSAGIWLLIFVVIAKDCANAAPNSKRRLFLGDVPTRYYPWALLALLAILFQSFHMSYVFSICVGYLDAYGKLGFTRLKAERRKRLENGVLRKFTEKEGFVPGPSGDSWNELLPHTNPPTAPSLSNTGPNQAGGGAVTGQGWTPTLFRKPQDSLESTMPSFESASGHRLGGSSRSRPNASPLSVPSRDNQESVNPISGTSSKVDRAALLAAAEKRANNSKIPDMGRDA